jgi:hypothetical protein
MVDPNYAKKETVIGGQVITLYSTDGRAWFSDREHIAEFKRRLSEVFRKRVGSEQGSGKKQHA